MLKAAAWLVGIGGSVLVAAGGQAPPTAMMPPPCAAREPASESPVDAAKLAQAQQIAVKYAVKFYTATMADMIDPLAPNYMEWAPSARRFNEINHVNSRDGARLEYETLSRLQGGGSPFGPDPYGPNSRLHLGDPAFMVFTQGHCVMVVAQAFRPDPQHPGQRYDVLAFDAFRVNDDGKITDHWDNSTIDSNSPLSKPVSTMHFPPAKRPIYGSDYHPAQ